MRTCCCQLAGTEYCKNCMTRPSIAEINSINATPYYIDDRFKIPDFIYDKDDLNNFLKGVEDIKYSLQNDFETEISYLSDKITKLLERPELSEVSKLKEASENMLIELENYTGNLADFTRKLFEKEGGE